MLAPIKICFGVTLLTTAVSAMAGTSSAPWAENRIVFGEKQPRSGVLTDARLKAIGDCGMNGVWLRINLRTLANTCISKRTA